MRLVLSLTLLALLLPGASARLGLPDDGAEAGNCDVRWSWYWPGETLGVTCQEGGRTLVAFSHGTCALGHYTYVQVGNGYVYLPCEWAWPASAPLA